MSKPIVITFSGGCFSGKTTTMNKLKQHLKTRGYRVAMLDELIRKEEFNSIDDMRKNPSEYLAFQNKVITAKMGAEKEILEMDDVDVVLVDRAITDSLFYLLFYVDKYGLSENDLEAFRKLEQNVTNHIKLAFDDIYDMVIEFRPLLTKCTDVKYRPEKIEQLKFIEHDIISILNRYAAHNNSAFLSYWNLNTYNEELLIGYIIEYFELEYLFL